MKLERESGQDQVPGDDLKRTPELYSDGGQKSPRHAHDKDEMERPEVVDTG